MNQGDMMSGDQEQDGRVVVPRKDFFFFRSPVLLFEVLRLMR